MDYLLDTNIIIIYSKSREKARKIEADHRIFAVENNLALSVVSYAEIRSLIHQFKIGDNRRLAINKLLDRTSRLGISYEEIIERYEEIDAYSQGRHQSLPSPFSARNMGKNDLWIAATASAFDITLVTTDRDFDHLHNVFVKLKFIDLAEYD